MMINTDVYAQGGFNINLSPNKVSVELPPGSRSLLSFRLSNLDDRNPTRVAVSLSDIHQGLRGQYLLTDSATDYSCLSWLELQDTIVEIPAAGWTDYQVPVQVPYRALGGAYGAVVFEILSEAPERQPGEMPQASSSYRFRMPAFIEISVKRSGGTKKRLISGRMMVRSADTDSLVEKTYGPDAMLVATEIMNTGNILLEVKGQLIIRDQDNRLVKRCPLGSGRGAILPSARTYLRSIVAKLRPGSYTLKSIIQYGGHSPAITTQNLEISRTSTIAGEAGISIPLEVELRPADAWLSVPAGAFRTLGATIINNEIFPVRVEVSEGQIYHDLEGELWTSPTADSGRSVCRWMDVEPTKFQMDPLSRKTIRLTINTPDSVVGGYYGCLLASVRVVDTVAGADDFLPSELSLPIVLEVPEALEYDGEITDLQIERNSMQGVTLKPVFRNTGNSHTTVRGFADIAIWSEDKPGADSLVVLSKPTFDEVGRVQIEPDSVYIFPGESRILNSQTMEQLPSGKYRATVKLTCGSQGKTRTTSMEKEFVIDERDI